MAPEIHCAPHHGSNQIIVICFRNLFSPYFLAIAQYRDILCNLKHFVQTMTDENYRAST